MLNKLNAIRKIKLLSCALFIIIFLAFSLIYRRIKKNTTQNPESLLTMSTNSRIMISTPTAIYTVGKKYSERGKASRDGPAVHTHIVCRRELFLCVCVCILLCCDCYRFFNERKNIKITVFYPPPRALRMRVYVLPRRCL